MKKYIKNDKSLQKIAWLRLIVNRILPVFVLLGAGFYFVPLASMAFQNNDVSAVDKQTSAVLFYNDECSHCREIYPKVFWHHVLHFNRANERIQTINVKNPNNAHYVTDYGIQETPTFMKPNQSDKRLVTTDFDEVDQFIKQ